MNLSLTLKKALTGGLGLLLAAPLAFAGETSAWLSGDFHQHTLYTDGGTSIDFCMEKDNAFGLDWWANSEHGGEKNTDGQGRLWDLNYPEGTILGAVELSSGHREMWRWQSLRDFVFPDIVRLRSTYPNRRILSGYEWNVPGHEHCSVGIVAQDNSAISAFEYMFDNSDDDFSRDGEITPFGTLAKVNGKNAFSQGVDAVQTKNKPVIERHADSVAACAWMQEQYNQKRIDNAWIVFAHVERAGSWDPIKGGGYNVEHFRDYNNAGPDVCFGFEGAPGHQANGLRGFGNLQFGGTYGGVGFYTAKVGGLWDALLGEGRRWFNFASSDYHLHHTAGGDDFFPGEYQRTWVKAVDSDNDGTYSLSEVADGLRAGNSFFVMGDLINALDFSLKSKNKKAEMGGKLVVKKNESVTLTIKFRSPTANAHGDRPVVDHIDLIMGEVTGKISPDDPNYKNPTNPSAVVLYSFNKQMFRKDKDGFLSVSFSIKTKDKKSLYFRLRGTNLAPGTPFETNINGDPLPDKLVTENLGLDGAAEAWADLWFYSNPIFVEVK